MSYRVDRLQEQIKKEISHIIKNQVKDPRIGFVTITRVELSRDKKFAKVFISIFGEESTIKKSFKGLESAKSFIRSSLGQSLRTRFTPEITFKPDFSAIHSMEITRILDELYPESADESDEQNYP